ncbi:uncharacterized protein LOC115364060 [Myripristis murdjan]|uniref:uncharacterized protein LOC115364060 n=1 Tax=Myripristis murdjan TaxID=586833 RepID=UPI001175FB43|nr:uncharacterized protein LOC115364060 [Myripristis murdjan]
MNNAERRNCREYSLKSPKFKKGPCQFNGTCNCSTKFYPVLGTSFSVTLHKGSEELGSKELQVHKIWRPKTPTITSVTQSRNGNYEVRWNNNYELTAIYEFLSYTVTYGKKGETPQNFTTKDMYYEIPENKLEPNTIYVVSVRTHTNLNNRISARSDKYEFKTSLSPYMILMLVIASLSVAAIIITTFMFIYCSRIKEKLWDEVAELQNPSFFNIHPGEPKILQPPETSFSKLLVLPCDSDEDASWSDDSPADTSSSGVHLAGSSDGPVNVAPNDIIASVRGALRMVLPQHAVTSSASDSFPTVSQNASGLLSRGVAFKTSPGLFDLGDTSRSGSDRQPPSVMSSDSAYQQNQGHFFGRNISPEQQALSSGQLYENRPCVPSCVLTNSLWKLPGAESAGDSGLSSVSGGISTSGSGNVASITAARLQSDDQSVSRVINLTDLTQDVCCESMKPCAGGLPAVSHTLPITHDYQAFQSLVTQPGVSVAEQSTGGERQLDQHPEERSNDICRASLEPVLLDFSYAPQCPFVLPLSADLSEAVLTVSGYQPV